ncbi:hypothetical protein [Xanthobacter tagetidis]|uniref:Uncharacterized protein n=1 Tax=Xanthobacter tagetidis TaxID=60216 RepID=A0A3L7AGM9_9HYPH|nr:hypothetical protein [Xanthobacter tagetidis]MBB6306366.1 hypothetical protein [Xanthobacter tagetidis]RLP79626.1 hypothetical protein D9R14_08205 [Xanthobacter tagetidis]
MGTRSDEDTLQTALRFFPGRASELLAQVRRNPGLVDMCEELSAAETALANTAALPAEVQADRREECRGWIARLTQEIEETLAAGKVVPLGQRSQG